MSKPTLIAFAGRKGSGKSTVALRTLEHLYRMNKQCKHDIIITSFAEPLKQLCIEYFGLSNEDVYGTLKEVVHPEWGTTPRKIMQFVGTDMFRNKLSELIPNANDFWVNHFKKRYTMMNCYDVVIVDDVRFPEEVKVIRELGGTLIKIKRENISLPSVSVSVDTHVSEQDLNDDLFDLVVNNNRTLDDLDCLIDEFLVENGIL